MAVTYPEIGNKVVAEIIESQGPCTIGMKPGDKFELSVHQCGEFCGYFYHNLFHWVNVLQFGGAFPLFEDKDIMEWDCPNPGNRVKVRLQRVAR